MVKPPDPSEVKVFSSAAELRGWFEKHHATETEAWIGYYRKGVPKTSVAYLEAVDEGLCFGWVDSVGYRVGDELYTNRFTPRRKGSTWSARNVERVRELMAEGRMHPAGIAAFEARTENRTGIYSYERRGEAELGPEFEARFRANPKAWAEELEERAAWDSISSKVE